MVSRASILSYILQSFIVFSLLPDTNTKVRLSSTLPVSAENEVASAMCLQDVEGCHVHPASVERKSVKLRATYIHRLYIKICT